MWKLFRNSRHLEPHSVMVSEHRNHTLLDMVHSMMSLIVLPLSFWGYALETTTFTLNRAPSKSVEMTPYEFWFGRNITCNFSEFGNATLMTDKLEPKAEKCIFIRYPKETVGITYISDPRAKCLLLKTGTFPRKGFSRKN